MVCTEIKVAAGHARVARPVPAGGAAAGRIAGPALWVGIAKHWVRVRGGHARPRNAVWRVRVDTVAAIVHRAVRVDAGPSRGRMVALGQVELAAIPRTFPVAVRQLHQGVLVQRRDPLRVGRLDGWLGPPRKGRRLLLQAWQR